MSKLLVICFTVLACVGARECSRQQCVIINARVAIEESRDRAVIEMEWLHPLPREWPGLPIHPDPAPQRPSVEVTPGKGSRL